MNQHFRTFSLLILLMLAFDYANVATAQRTQQFISNKTTSLAKDSDKIEFTNEVLSVLSKLGCNSGACHGALAGKGGFRLSLRGYDPAGDHYNITQQSKGRRIEFADPGRSLLLIKPTGVVAHKGGLRLDPDSEDYRLLAQWIAEGAPGPGDKERKLDRIEVLPNKSKLQVGHSKALKVIAHYKDGTDKDVTRWAKFESSNTPVAKVNEDGQVSVVGAGEASIVAWFSSRLAVAQVQSPFENQVNVEMYSLDSESSFIDRLVTKKLQQLNLEPSGKCDDATFLRRAFLDTIGILPTPDETRRFLENTQPNKREALVDALLERDEFVDYWTYKWADIFLINGKRLRPKAVKAYYSWLRGQIKVNRPWDQMVREVVTAQGDSYENGATNFYALHQSPEEMAENTSQAFLGLSIGCAKCHNHPLEKWTNDQYYAMANLFARVRAKGWGGDGRNGDGRRTVFVVKEGDLIQPLTGKPQRPTPLDGIPLSFDDPQDRREHLANWITAKDNPYFARSITNRVWANFMGRGLVEDVDDMRISNPASNEPLLNALAEFLVENQYDLKSLMREILNSQTYQRSSLSIPNNSKDDRFYARFYPRRLMAEVLLDSISQVTKVPTPFTRVKYDGADFQATKEYPLGTRAIELYDSAIDSSFLTTFGRNNRDIVCECERSNKPSMVQVLHIANGKTINEKLSNKNSCVSSLMVEPDEIDIATTIDEGYLACFSRFPTKAEKSQLTNVLQSAPPEQRREALEDFYWSLLSSREFLFQH